MSLVASLYFYLAILGDMRFSFLGFESGLWQFRTKETTNQERTRLGASFMLTYCKKIKLWYTFCSKFGFKKKKKHFHGKSVNLGADGRIKRNRKIAWLLKTENSGNWVLRLRCFQRKFVKLLGFTTYRKRKKIGCFHGKFVKCLVLWRHSVENTVFDI